MCGFAGVISWSEQHRTTRETLARMSAAIAHRGPDGEGIYCSIDPDDLATPITPERPQVALAFRRLAVLDPTPCSDQPFVSTDGRYVLVFNGEIYNFKDLRSEISDLRPDYVWRTHGDTEVLLMAYAVWGERCVDRLNGMFAFAVWDHQEQTLFLARDRMGQKPLFATHISPTDGAMRFSSEIQGLGPVSVQEGTEAHMALMSYLAFGRPALVSPIRAGEFSPGSAVTYRFDWARVYRELPLDRIRSAGFSTAGMENYRGPASGGSYFDPGSGLQFREGDPESITSAKYAPLGANPSETIRAAIERAVERQLVSDVPLGVFLSGGIDSSVIAACARKHGPVKTFSIGFDDPRYDETKYAAEVAKHLGTEHHAFRVTPNVIEDLPKLARVFGVPFADSSALPTHYLSRETRKHVTVALSGDGGDELFGGYERYVAMRKAERVPKWLGKRLAPLAHRFTGGHPKSKLQRAARFADSLDLDPPERYSAFHRLFTDLQIHELFGSWRPRRRMLVVGLVDGFRIQYEAQFARTQNVVRAALATDRVTYLPDDLLVKTDRCSMLNSLEVRSPFMDHELVGLAAQLTEDQLLKGGKKRMLREAFSADLPASVFNRPKMGFAVPIGEWFRGPLRAFLRDHLFAADSFARAHFSMPAVERLVEEHETSRRDHSQRLYALLMLELWWAIQKEGAMNLTNGTN